MVLAGGWWRLGAFAKELQSHRQFWASVPNAIVLVLTLFSSSKRRLQIEDGDDEVHDLPAYDESSCFSPDNR